MTTPTPASAHTRSGARDWWRADNGHVTAFVVVLMTAILALAGVALDGGLALAAKVRAIGHAEAAARAGAQAIDLNTLRSTGRIVLAPDEAIDAAHSHLQTAHADGVVTIDNQPGTGDVIVVRVTANHPTQLLGLVGVTTLTVHGEARSTPVGS